jgi:pyruvate,orthophosphate dikinase
MRLFNSSLGTLCAFGTLIMVLKTAKDSSQLIDAFRLSSMALQRQSCDRAKSSSTQVRPCRRQAFIGATALLMTMTQSVSGSISPLSSKSQEIPAKIDYATAIVGFGGSAPSVMHPNRELLGGKGLGLQEMSNVGIDVPPGFTLTTPLCYEFNHQDDTILQSGELWNCILAALGRLERDMGRKFGDTTSNPLLLSCRSGAAVSMPGMMDTVLNVGLNLDTVVGLANATGNKRFAYDSYRRLLDMFGGVVLGIPHEAFEKQLRILKERVGVTNDVDLTGDHLEELCDMYQSVYQQYGTEFPYDVYDQLRACIRAVFASWNSERAVKYREINGMTNRLLGTACNIQTMVYGNLGRTSGTGVAFSRDPGTGHREIKGEFLFNAQGEDVVAGIRTPEPLDTMANILPEC